MGNYRRIWEAYQIAEKFRKLGLEIGQEPRQQELLRELPLV